MFWAVMAMLFGCLWIGTLGLLSVTALELHRSSRKAASLSTELQVVLAAKGQDALQELTDILDETEGALRYSEWLRRLERREYISTIREARWMQRQFDRMSGR